MKFLNKRIEKTLAGNTIEARINRALAVICFYNDIRGFPRHRIEERWWEGEPASIGRSEAVKIQGSPYTKDQVNQEFDVLEIVDNMIRDASPAECLSSPAEYIRECKKWFMQQEL